MFSKFIYSIYILIHFAIQTFFTTVAVEFTIQLITPFSKYDTFIRSISFRPIYFLIGGCAVMIVYIIYAIYIKMNPDYLTLANMKEFEYIKRRTKLYEPDKRIRSLFDEVYNQSGINKDVWFFIMKGTRYKARAYGNAVLLKEDILENDNNTIKAIIAHELGHVQNDTLFAIFFKGISGFNIFERLLEDYSPKIMPLVRESYVYLFLKRQLYDRAQLIEDIEADNFACSLKYGTELRTFLKEVARTNGDYYFIEKRINAIDKPKKKVKAISDKTHSSSKSSLKQIKALSVARKNAFILWGMAIGYIFIIGVLFIMLFLPLMLFINVNIFWCVIIPTFVIIVTYISVGAVKIHTTKVAGSIEPDGAAIRLTRLKYEICHALGADPDFKILICHDKEWNITHLEKGSIVINQSLLSCDNDALTGYLAHEITHQQIVKPTLLCKYFDLPRVLLDGAISVSLLILRSGKFSSMMSQADDKHIKDILDNLDFGVFDVIYPRFVFHEWLDLKWDMKIDEYVCLCGLGFAMIKSLEHNLKEREKRYTEGLASSLLFSIYNQQSSNIKTRIEKINLRQ